MNALERLRFALEAQGRRHPLLRTVLLLVLLAGSFALNRLVNPAVPAGTPGILELQVAGTRETVDSLLAAASRPVLANALAWDYLFIVLYGLLLPALLVLFRPAGDLASWDRWAPRLVLLAAALDVVRSQCESLKVLGSYPKAEAT